MYNSLYKNAEFFVVFGKMHNIFSGAPLVTEWYNRKNYKIGR